MDLNIPLKKGDLFVNTRVSFGNRGPAPSWQAPRFMWLILLAAVMLCGSGGSLARAANFEDGNGTTSSAKTGDSADKNSAHPPTDSSTSNAKSTAPATADADKYNTLDEKVRKLEDIVKQQQMVIDALQNRLNNPASASASAAAAPSTSGSGTATPAAAGTAQPVSGAPAGTAVAKGAQDKAEEAPLQFHIGTATIMPVGFIDFTSVFRSTNAGSGIGSNFGSIPFGNTVPGHLTENRLSLQNSRVGARIDADVKGTHVIGYWESDFLGGATAAIPNLNVSTNSNIFRLRLFWVDLRRDKLEVLGGQSWSMMTPNRVGISAIPGDIFFSQDVDVNYQVGLTWARQPQFRLVYHASDVATLGLSFENPEQYIGGSGGGGVITAPSLLAASYIPGQLDNGTNGIAVPNLHPDIVAKVAFDPKVSGKAFHIEFEGVARSFKVFNTLTQQHFTSVGGGGALNLNLEIFKGFRLISNNYISDGGGRYIFGQAPDLVIRGDGSASLVHSYSTIQGFEAQAAKNTLLYFYYGGVYIGKNVIIDPATGKPVGYGFTGSGTSANRNEQEITGGLTQTFWRDPKYGGLQFMFQYSYELRHPWSVPTGQPADTHTNAVFLNLRYLFPGTAPKVTYGSK